MIVFSHVSKRYDGRPVIEDLSLTIQHGTFVALVGQSGAGKTTLLKTINRLAEIDGGTIEIDGQDIATLPLTALRRRVGYAFQGVGLFPHMTVAENIGIGLKLQGMPAAQRSARMLELLALTSLPSDLSERRPFQLSGGQAQRVGFARALAARPAVMLMDEPFGALDPVTRSELGRAYREMHNQMGLTSILVTHDMTEAMLLADRIIVLGQGRILADAPPIELMAFRGDPGVRGMIDVVRDQVERLNALSGAH